MKTTHELTERAISSLLRLLSRSSPAEQPSGDVLRALQELLALHRRGTPAEGLEERLAALKAKVDRIETMAGITTGRQRR